MKNTPSSSAERLSIEAITTTLDSSYATAAKQLFEERRYAPTLAVISGYDPGLRIPTQRALAWRRPEMRYAEQVECQTQGYIVKREAIAKLIDELNNNTAVSGIVLELPVPETAKEYRNMAAKAGGKFIEQIRADKDVIGLRRLSAKAPIAMPDEYPGAQAAAIRRIIDQRDALGWDGGPRVTFAGLDDSLTAAYLKDMFRSDASFYEVPKKVDSKDLVEQKKCLHERMRETDILVTDRRLSRILGRSMLRPDMLVVDMGTYAMTRSSNKLLEPTAKEPKSFGDVDIPLSYISPRDIARVTLREVIDRMMLSPEKSE